MAASDSAHLQRMDVYVVFSLHSLVCVECFLFVLDILLFSSVTL